MDVCYETRLADRRLHRAAIKPVLHEKEKFSRTDSQQLIIKGINPLNLSQSIH